MELRLLRAFVTVAEEGHVGRAARRLHIAQPPLSRQLRQLGESIGTPVVERHGRGIRLTPAGAALLPEARAILVQAEHARRCALDTAKGVRGHLRVAYVDSTSFSGVLPRLLRRFRTLNPGVGIDLMPHRSLEQWPLLRDRRTDVGILYWPPGDADLTVRAIATDTMRVALPPGHRLARARRIRVRDLAEEELIAFPRRYSPLYHDRIHEAFRRHGCAMRVRMEAPHELVTLGLVAAGVGPALVIGSYADLRPRGVLLRPVSDLDLTLTVSACWLAERGQEPVIASFARVLPREVGTRPGA